MTFIKKKWQVLLLIFVGFLVFAFNINNVLFWDDIDWIVNNPHVHSFSLSNIGNWFSDDVLGGVGLSSNYYRPLLLFTYAINYSISGTVPWSWHLFSNSIHIINGLLVF